MLLVIGWHFVGAGFVVVMIARLQIADGTTNIE
jgi:hypothetical protein